MTENEKNTTHSEITGLSDKSEPASALYALHVDLYYTIFDRDVASLITSPVTGFLNILFPASSSPCISPYFLHNNSYVIRGGENILHPIQKGETLEWRNTYGENIAIALFIPHELLADFSIKIQEDLNRFENGLLTTSDNRIVLLIGQILELSRREHQLNNLRMQSLLIETLVHQIEGLYAENDKHEVILNKNHYDKIILTKSIIDRDLSKNYTIAELAKEVGTNEQYLKKYFKQHFGKTILSYTTHKKMEYAKELIMTGNFRITDVARLTGYKHSTHFTTSFKKHFGFIPNSLRYTFMIAQEGAQQILSEVDGLIGML